MQSLSIPDNRRPRRRKKSPAGFTLIEILVSFLIFAIILTTLFGSYQLVFSKVDSIDEVNGLYEMAKNGLDRMVQDLQSLHVSLPPVYRPPDMNDPADAYRLLCETESVAGSEFSRLRFTSLSHLPLENSAADGIAEITYYVHQDENDRFVLRRSDKLYPYGPFAERSQDPILCRDVKSLAFIFFDETGKEYERWDSDSKAFEHATPRSVAIRLEIGDDHQAIVMETAVELPVFRAKSN